MRIIALLTLLLAGTIAQAQDAPAPKVVSTRPDTIYHAPFVDKSTTVSLSLGFIDGYRTNYTYPSGYTKKTTTGFPQVTARIEYAVSSRISLAAAFMYDEFTNDYYQNVAGTGTTHQRVRRNDVHIFSGGIGAYYHFDVSKRFDPFIGVGVAVNNYKQSASPQADSTISTSEHPVTGFIKAGVRYYITDKASFMAEAGYDKTSIFNIGFSCRFFKRR